MTMDQVKNDGSIFRFSSKPCVIGLKWDHGKARRALYLLLMELNTFIGDGADDQHL